VAAEAPQGVEQQPQIPRGSRGLLVRAHLRDERLELKHRSRDRRAEHVVLGRKVAVHQASGDARLLTNLLHRRALHAEAGEAASRRVDEPWLGFEAVRGLDGLGDDVLMIPLFGHTHGHCGIAVNTDDGWLLDAGDAYFDAREIKLPERKCGPIPAQFQMMVTTERDKRREDQDRLRALHADHPEVEIFCGHNPFEYLDLVEKSGGTPRGISPTHRPASAGRR